MDGESAEVESYHAALQRLTDDAPFMSQSLANARINLKFGRPVTPEVCCEHHKEANSYQGSDEHQCRYALVTSDEISSVPETAGDVYCPTHMLSRENQLAWSLCSQFAKLHTTGAAYAYAMGRDSLEDSPSFLFIWTYRKINCYISTGLFRERAGTTYFQLDMPLRSHTLASFLPECWDDTEGGGA